MQFIVRIPSKSLGTIAVLENVRTGEVKKVEEEKETATCELSSAESFLKSI